MKLTKDKLIDTRSLTKDEKKVFIVFLTLERERHIDDILKINKTVTRLNKQIKNGKSCRTNNV